jgi:hypothetical protein
MENGNPRLKTSALQVIQSSDTKNVFLLNIVTLEKHYRTNFCFNTSLGKRIVCRKKQVFQCFMNKSNDFRLQMPFNR